MALILAGMVQIGNPEDELRRHALSLEGAKADSDFVEEFLGYVRNTQGTNRPPRRVQVAAFWMDKYEVTNAEYARFVARTNRLPPSHWKGNTPPADRADHPVTNVSHADALAYAAWAGKQLPTEEQWVRAYRGDKDWIYPWGNLWDSKRANARENLAFPDTSGVADTPEDVSASGVYNLVGNVSEMLRERVPKQGKRMVATRGANAKSTGQALGSAVIGIYFADDLEVNPMTGFRCVREEP